jgi:methionyl-tRNA formyltransferase
MKITVFCDSIKRIPEFRARVAGDGQSQDALVFIVCNNARHDRLRFVAGQFWHARRYRLKDWIDLVQDLLNDRLCLSLDPLGSPKTRAFLERHPPDLALHAMGVIYRDNIIARCGLGILNAHIGRLPKYRGRSVMEWSILCGDATGVTVFFIDAGIDTGRKIVLWQAVPVDGFRGIDEAKHHLFSKDVELYRKAIDRIRDGAPFECNDVTQGLRFYEMSSLFRAELTSYFERDR